MTIDHIALYVQDLEGGKAFFETYFEGTAGDFYHNDKTGFSSYFVSFSDGARLELMNLPGLERSRDSRTAGYAHIAFHAGSKEAVDRLTGRLRADGYTVFSEPRLTGDGYYESVIEDKEGNRIEITI